jgi:type II secretory pathway component PulC
MCTPRSTQHSITITALLSAAIAVGCAARNGAPSRASASEQSAAGSQSDSTTSVASSSASVNGRALTRALIEETVAQGLGVFLSRVSVAPVLEGRRFVGFRLESAEDLDAWRAAGADLRVGDVIQRINGQSIERPEQAMWAFNQLRIAPGIEVIGLRGSAPFRVYSPIVDGAASGAAHAQ